MFKTAILRVNPPLRLLLKSNTVVLLKICRFQNKKIMTFWQQYQRSHLSHFPNHAELTQDRVPEAEISQYFE